MHYSNVSFRVGSIISTGLSTLVFTGTAFYGKLPYSGAYMKTCVSHGLKSCILFENHASKKQDAQVKKSLQFCYFQECLSVIMKYCDIDWNSRDIWGRSVMDVASSQNKELLLKHG